MKIKLYFFILLFSFQSHAIEFVQDDSKRISDLMYIPLRGHLFIETGYSSIGNDVEITYLNQNLATIDNSRSALSLETGYGINEKTSFSVEIGYVMKNEDETTYGPSSTLNGTTTVDNNKGRTDPTLNIIHRFLLQDEVMPYLDLKIFFSPKTGDSETGSTAKDGNSFKGGSEFGFSVKAGKKYETFQFYGEIGLNSYGTRETKLLSDNTTTKVDSVNDWRIGGEIQSYFSETLFARAELALMILGDYDQTNTGVKTEVSNDNALIFSLGFGLELSENSYVLLTYGSTQYESTVTTTGTILEYEHDLSGFLVDFRYQF